tara:strand:+ start:340 stop:543 length:204 start_codon:yes stop_codon:yes gene_type:complete
MEITSAQYIQDEGVNSGIKINNSQTVDPDGNGNSVYIITVPIDPANTDYAEIMRQVNAGTLTIADAD